MSKHLKLITEAESANYDLEFVFEQSGRETDKKLFIKGRYLMLDEKNRNGRSYLSEDMIPAIEKYKTDFVDRNRSCGTLNHESSADIDLSKVCHKIVSLEPDKSNSKFWIGKSLVMSTPSGKILESFIRDDFSFGMSSRALGRIVQEGSNNVVRDPIICSIDAVYDPSIGGGGSVGDKATGFVNGILENKEYIISDDGKVAEAYAILEKKLAKYPSRHSDAIKEHILESFKAFLNSI